MEMIVDLEAKAAHEVSTRRESSQRDSAESRFHDGTSVKAQQAPGALRKGCRYRRTSTHAAPVLSTNSIALPQQQLRHALQSR